MPPKTREFVIEGGSDRAMWGDDIDGPADAAWAAARLGFTLTPEEQAWRASEPDAP